MSKQLLDSVERFLGGETPVEKFVDTYIDSWRAEGNSGKLRADDAIISRKLSSIFCVVDLYNPDEDREEYEFDEARLRAEVQKLLEGAE